MKSKNYRIKSSVVLAAAMFGVVLLLGSPFAAGQIAPAITTQPQRQVVDFGADVAFSVTATGTEPLAYQWYGNHLLTDHDNIVGSQMPTLYLVGVGQADAQRYCVVVSNTAGSVTSSVVSLIVKPRVVLQDDFENGLGQWTPLLDGEPMAIDSSQNHTTNEEFSAMITNSAQKMYYRLNPKQDFRVRLTMWIYDDGGAQTAYSELRGYTGETGYAKYAGRKGLRQCFAAGMNTSDFGTNNTGSLSGETQDPTKYQGRVMNGTNTGWFNLNGPGAPSRSPGWHQFVIDRSRFLTNVDFYVDGVLARRITGVKPAPLDTVTLGSTGLGENNQWPIVPESAWFDDVMVEAFERNFDYQTLATRGPIPDLMQLLETGTAASVVNVSPQTVCEVAGAATNYSVGSWAVNNAELVAQGVRGYVEYAVSAPQDNAYRIEIEGRENDFKMPRVAMKLAVSIDGEPLGQVDLPYCASSNGLAHCFTPFIRAGTHTVGVYWNNARPRCALAVHAIRLQNLSGGDLAGNGMPMWVVNRLLAQCGMDSPPTASVVSPVCLEGRGPYLSMMSLQAGTSSPLSPVTVHHGAGDRWYANVPLSPGGPTYVEVWYQNGGLTETNDIEWGVTDLLNATNVVIRNGDSLLFSAFPPGVTNGAMAIQVGGQTPIEADASTPVPYQFTAAGTYTVTGQYGPTGASGSITVKVVDASLGRPLPLRVGLTTYWDCINFPPGVVLDSDPRLVISKISAAARAKRMTNSPPLGVNGKEFRVIIRSPEPEYVLARLGKNGPILASTSIQGFELTSPPVSSFRLMSTQADGSQNIEGMWVLSPVLNGVSVDLTVAAAGVTFGDGTLAKTLTTADFDQLGVCRVAFIRAAGVEGSACMVQELHAEAEGTNE